MKKTVFAVLVLVIGLTMAGCGDASDSNGGSGSRNVEFEDFLVERCVREALGKKWDEKVTEKELASLKELTISWKKDIALGYNAVNNGFDYTGYVDLADLKYLTGLEDLNLDLFVQFITLENMDAIAGCKQLKSLTMQLPLRERSELFGYIGKGYSYLRDIFAELPELESVDFGVSVPEPLQDLLQPEGSERRIVFAESENSFQVAMMSMGAGAGVKAPRTQILEDEDILVLSSDDLKSSEPVKDVYEKQNRTAESVEDVFVYMDSGDVFDCETLADLRNLKTLVICSKGSWINGTESRVIHLEALSELPDLCVLSLFNVQVDFEGCEFSNLRELYLFACEAEESFGLLKLPSLRELSLVANNRSEGGICVPEWDVWSNMPELRYLNGYFSSDECEYLADVFEEMKGKTKLETLVLSCGITNEKFTNILSDITEDLELKTLYVNTTDGRPMDLRRIECNDSLENFACISAAEHLTEFVNMHPNLTTVVVTNSIAAFERTDKDAMTALTAYLNEAIEAAVQAPNLTMLSLFALMSDYANANAALIQGTDLMSLYEAGIYDGWIQYGAFIRDMDVETYYYDRISAAQDGSSGN